LLVNNWLAVVQCLQVAVLKLRAFGTACGWLLVAISSMCLACVQLVLCCPAGDNPIASDRLKRYLAIGASLANARAHKVGLLAA
jgi:hypothetical protein